MEFIPTGSLERYICWQGTQPIRTINLFLINRDRPHTLCQQLNLHASETYVEIKPGLFMLTNLVKVQVSFVIIHVARHEYTFVPKLRAICLLDCIVEKVRFQSGLQYFSLMSAHIYNYKTWLEIGHYWQLMIDEAQMYLKLCLTYPYCILVTHLLNFQRPAHYYTS